MNTFFYILKVLAIVVSMIAIMMGINNIITILVDKMFCENDNNSLSFR